MRPKEKGQMPFPTNREHMTPTRWKKASIATKKEKGQIPFPTDRALNDADKVKNRPVSRQKNHKCIKKKR